MNESQPPPSERFFKDFMAEYGKAWDDNDLQAVLDAYYTPCFIFKAGKVHANLNESDKRRYFGDLLRDYHQKKVARAEIPHCEVKRLGDNSALITLEWLCKRADGEVVFNYWDSYHLIHVDGQWKILDDTVHDPVLHQA